jgi:hypothetical protein
MGESILQIGFPLLSYDHIDPHYPPTLAASVLVPSPERMFSPLYISLNPALMFLPHAAFSQIPHKGAHAINARFDVRHPRTYPVQSFSHTNCCPWQFEGGVRDAESQYTGIAAQGSLISWRKFSTSDLRLLVHAR